MLSPYKHAFAAVGALVLIGLVGAPAAGVGPWGDPSPQPPPGTVATHIGPIAPVPTQPPAGAKAVQVTKVAPVPQQPVNAHPTKTGPPVGLRHNKGDEGKKNLAPTKDRGVKNLPVRRDLGDHQGGRH